MNFWTKKKVLLIGGLGFIGSHVVDLLLKKGSAVTVLTRNPQNIPEYLTSLTRQVKILQGDCTKNSDVEPAYVNQEIVLNLAAHVGGIQYNRTHQGSMLAENMLLQTIPLQAAQKKRIERYLVVSSACVYPRDSKIPTPETEGFRGEPEPTNGGYGWAKRFGELAGNYFAEEYGMKIGIVRPYNAYGPRDHFDTEYGHVIPALIARVFSGENPLSVWGSGKQTRAFLYVEDLAEGMLSAIEKYPVADPINLGTDEEISIKDLIEAIVAVSGKKVQIQFDTSKPDGSPRRNSDNTKAKEKINFVAQTGFRTGLEKTILWYEKHYRSKNN